MDTLGIGMRLEAIEFALQIDDVPEQDVIQELTGLPECDLLSTVGLCHFQ